MKKIKKGVAVVAALLLMSSGSLNANTNTGDLVEIKAGNCFGTYVFVYESAIAAGASTYEAFNLASIAFNNCVGNQ